MPSFTTAAKDEILSNKAVRQHFPNQQSFGLMVFSREFSVPKMQMLTRERRAAQYYSQLVQSVRPMTGTVTLREEKLSTGQLAYRVTVDDMADRIDLYNHFAMLRRASPLSCWAAMRAQAPLWAGCSLPAAPFPTRR